MPDELIIGSDHRGFELKEALKKTLARRFDIADAGVENAQMSDFPEVAQRACRQVLNRQCKAILICGTGFGMAIAANKMHGIRAATCREELDAHYAREHNDCNVLCLGANFTSEEKARRIIETFLSTQFSNETRYSRRNDQIAQLEKDQQ